MRLVINIYSSKWWEMTRKEACWVDLKIRKISWDHTGSGRGQVAVLSCWEKLALVTNARGVQNRSSGRGCVCIGGRRDLEAISTFIEFISHRLAWFGLYWAGKSKAAQKTSTCTSNLFRKFVKELETERLWIRPVSYLKVIRRERGISGKMGADPPCLPVAIATGSQLTGGPKRRNVCGYKSALRSSVFPEMSSPFGVRAIYIYLAKLNSSN